MVLAPLDALLLLLPLLWEPGQAKATTAMAVLSFVLLAGGGRYRARLRLSFLDELPSLLGKLLAATAAIATVIALRHELEAVVIFLNNTALAIGLVLTGRFLTTKMIARSRRRRHTEHRAVVIGGGAVAADLCRVLHNDHQYGLRVVGFVDNGAGCLAEAWAPRLGKLADLDEAVRKCRTRVLLVADGELSEAELIDALRTPSCVPCDLLVVPRLHHFHTQTGLPDNIGSIPIMRIRTPLMRGYARIMKRAFDLTVAISALIMAFPVLALCALAVKLEGGSGVIFRQQRVGRDGVVFDCLKFRSMRPADEAESATNWSIATDERVGLVGRLLRRTSLDELPQLWNIVRGDMTLVGPRPERPHFVSQFSVNIDRYAHRHRVQAGLTGLAQVNGLRGDTSIADRARYDNYYIENWSLWLDIKIILWTFREVFLAKGR